MRVLRHRYATGHSDGVPVLIEVVSAEQDRRDDTGREALHEVPDQRRIMPPEEVRYVETTALEVVEDRHRSRR